MPTMTPPATDLPQALASARERVGFTQDDVAALIGQQRPVISMWESGEREPNSHQLSKLSAIYRIPLDELLGAEERPRVEFEQLLFRDAGDRLDARGKAEIQGYLGFLDDYAGFLDALGEEPGLMEPPFHLSRGFTTREDIRRKAQDARALFGLGTGPVGDLLSLADRIGITVYLAPLGDDLKRTVSGAFVPHGGVGFSILINAETTPGRRQFTFAHELGHALFHGDALYVDYFGRREAGERFANAFAAEFLVPAQSLRSAVEAFGEVRIRDPETVVHLQRYFGVSYLTMLVRLGAAGLADAPDIERMRQVAPVRLAESLGYSTEPDEWMQSPRRWGLARFPRRFLRLLRRAFDAERITLSGASAMTGVAQEEIEAFLSYRVPPSDTEPSNQTEEFEFLSESARP
ncbi:MAG: helix-turn-helix domain-containing protein [Solirubrobacterales bacterium]